jgi:hypothetical protein
MTFMSRIIDKMILDLNENKGKNWIDTVRDLKRYFADRIPGIN